MPHLGLSPIHHYRDTRPSHTLSLHSPMDDRQVKSTLVVGVSGLAVVADQLEAADDLAHGEEAEHLGEQDAAADDLRPRDVPDLAHGRVLGGLGARGGGGLQQALGVLDGVDGAVEVCLDGGGGTA